MPCKPAASARSGRRVLDVQDAPPRADHQQRVNHEHDGQPEPEVAPRHTQHINASCAAFVMWRPGETVQKPNTGGRTSSRRGAHAAARATWWRRGGGPPAAASLSLLPTRANGCTSTAGAASTTGRSARKKQKHTFGFGYVPSRRARSSPTRYARPWRRTMHERDAALPRSLPL